MMHLKQLLKIFWVEAISCIAYQLNRCVIKIVYEMTP